MIIHQISVFLENRSGQLAEITQALADESIDLRAIHIAESTDYGVVRLIVADPDHAEKVLKDRGFVVHQTPVVAVTVPDRAGGLNDVLGILSKNNIDIKYMYSLFVHHTGKAYMIFRVENPDSLTLVLTINGYPTASSKELGF